MRSIVPALILGATLASPAAADEHLLNKIYTPPGPVAVDGGVPSPTRYVAPDDVFVTDYVLNRPVKTDYDDSVNIAVGGWLNDNIRLHPVPGTGYAYASVNGVTVLADANRQRIVKIYPQTPR